jgi:hypothetical protein
MMTDIEFRQWLQMVVEEAQEEEDPSLSSRNRVSSFADEGLLTDKQGIVVRTEDGSEWQVSITRSN